MSSVAGQVESFVAADGGVYRSIRWGMSFLEPCVVRAPDGDGVLGDIAFPAIEGDDAIPDDLRDLTDSQVSARAKFYRADSLESLAQGERLVLVPETSMSDRTLTVRRRLASPGHAQDQTGCFDVRIPANLWPSEVELNLRSRVPVVLVWVRASHAVVAPSTQRDVDVGVVGYVIRSGRAA